MNIGIDWQVLSQQWLLTFAHFLWQATVVAAVLGMVLRLTKNASSRVRYAVSCCAMSALLVCVVATFAIINANSDDRVVGGSNSAASSGLPMEMLVGPVEVSFNTAIETSTSVPVIVADELPGSFAEEPPTSQQPSEPEPITWRERFSKWSPFLMGGYCLGVLCLLSRIGLAVWSSRRLKVAVRAIEDSAVLQVLAEQASKLGLRRVPLAEICDRVSVPVVVGILKPMILLPPALLCGLDPQHLSAILTHELAHIRRYDLIVNLLQRVVEALLFFHPATWWISRRIRIEREHCCDDMVAANVGRLPYATALIRMAEICISNDRSRLATLASLSADGGNSTDFGQRIRRLIGEEDSTRIGLTRRGVTVGISLASLLMVSLVAWGQNQPSADEKPVTLENDHLPAIFSPSPLWQTKLADDEAVSGVSFIWSHDSPFVVAGDRVHMVGRDFDLRSGTKIENPSERLPRIGEFEVTLAPVLRRVSSDRAFIVEVSQRIPGKTLSRPSFDLRVLRVADGSQVGVTITIAGPFDGNACDVDIENGGDFLLLGDSQSVRVYRVETGQIETTLPEKIKRIDAVAFSPDREWLVVSNQNDLHFWRWRDQAPVKSIHVGRKIDALKFTSDGQYLVEGPDCRTDMQIRDMRTLEIVASLKDQVGSPLMVSSMDITPDGRYLVAHNEVSVDETKLTIPHRIHVWDLQTRKPVFQIATGEWVRSVAFSNDGRMIVGEFSGAAHGAMLAAWKLPDELIDRKVDPPIDGIDRLGDGIQWSMWGDKDGLLSGARLILPEGGLKPGQPLIVEYRLANVSTGTKTVRCYLNKGMRFTSLGGGNRIGGFGLDWNREPVTLTIEPGEVFVDTDHLVSIDTTGLEPGNYQAALGSAFRFPDLIDPNSTHEIPHRGSIRFSIVGESTVKISELPKSDIHWGKTIAGLQLGARFTGDPTAFAIGATVEADLFVANVTDQSIEGSVALPHPQDGWLFNVEDRNGDTIMLQRPIQFSSPFPERHVSLKLAPGEIVAITGEGIPVNGGKSSLPRAKFQIVGTQEDATQPFQYGDSQGRLVSQGGRYSAIFDVTLLRPDIPALRLKLDTSNVEFLVIGPEFVADQIPDNPKAGVYGIGPEASKNASDKHFPGFNESPGSVWFHSADKIHFVICNQGTLQSGLGYSGTDVNPRKQHRLWHFDGHLTAWSGWDRNSKKRPLQIQFEYHTGDWLSLQLDGQTYDLADGRVFLISADGKLSQSNIPLPALDIDDKSRNEWINAAFVASKHGNSLYNIVWGEPVGGLRLGIRPADYAKRKDRFRHGDWMRYEVWIKNESADVIRIPRDPRDRAEPAIDGKGINLLGDRSSDSFSLPAEVLEKATISVSPGEVGLLESPQAPIYAADGPTRRYGSSPLRLAPGKYGTHAIRDVSYSTKDSHGNIELRSGSVEIEVLPLPHLQIREVNESTKSTLELIAKNPSLQVIELATTDGQKREFVFDNASEVLVDDDDLASVRAIANEQEPPGYSVEITLKPDMANWLAERTKQLSQRPKNRPMLGIFIDGKLHSAPRLNSPIPDGKLIINGQYTKAEADKLVAILSQALLLGANSSEASSDQKPGGRQELEGPLEGKSNLANTRTLQFKLVVGETGTPMQGIQCKASIFKQGTPPQLRPCKSNEQGIVELEVTEGKGAWIAEVPDGWFTSTPSVTVIELDENGKPKHEQTGVNNNEPTEVKLWRGTEIDGRLLWPDKTPAAGVKLTAGVYINNQSWKQKLGMDLKFYSFDHGDWPNWSRTIFTDEEGRFRVTVPPNNARSWLRIGTTQLSFGPQTGFGENDATTRRLAKCEPLEVDYENSPPIVDLNAKVGNYVWQPGDLQLEAGVIVRGRVVDAEGNGLSHVHLTTTGSHGPHSGRKAISGEDGKFEFPAIRAGILTVHPDARLRDISKPAHQKVISRDVQAVFIDQSFTIISALGSNEIIIRAVPHTEVLFEWVDRRADKTQPIAYYGAFRVRGYMPDDDGKPSTYWTSETERVKRDGKSLLAVKIPTQLLKPELMLLADRRVTASYSDTNGITSGPGIVQLGDITANITRTIFGDEPPAPKGEK